MIVGVLTTCHTQYTWDRSICRFLFNRTTLKVFVTYLTGALYVHPLWFYKHQHENRVHSKLSVARQWWWCQWQFWFVPSVLGYLREEEEHKPDPVPLPPTRQRIFEPAFTTAMDRAWDRWWSDATRLATSFFLWGYVKDQIYVPPLPASIPELKVRIRTAIDTITAEMLQTVWNELDFRVDVCRITKGAHIEHL